MKIVHSPITWAHHLWEQFLKEGDWAIDATCGNGKDCEKLAQLLSDSHSGVIGLDIQQCAIDATRKRVPSSNVHLFCQSHAAFPPLAGEVRVRLIVYNLGYLPKGDKSLTTLRESTLLSFRAACSLIPSGGAICITCYPGHPEGALEEEALLKEISALPSSLFEVCFHRWVNRPKSPSLFWIEKI
jgi:SAM-dependent methyltransferase